MADSMRVALLAPLVSPIAPPFLGGAQALLSDLASGLAARGHDVTLYAADGSHVPGARVVELGIDASTLRSATFAREEAADAHDPSTAQSPSDEDDADPFRLDEDATRMDYAFLHAYRVIAGAARAHDLVHAHAYDWPAYIHGALQPLPIVHTLHLPPLDPQINAALRTLAPPGKPLPHARAPRLVTVSQASAEAYAPYAHIDAVIYNGIEVERIPFAAEAVIEDGEPYLLYAGRITPEKGVEDALEIAARAGRRLKLAGGVYDERYFAERVAPRLAASGGRAVYLGPLGREALWQVMAGAQAVLCPARWDEPFGLVACEAQAAGAPVVGYARGGLREVVADGETGWLVSPDDLDAAVAAVAQVERLNRLDCRLRVERRFGLAAMLDAYEAFYARMLAQARAEQEGER